MLIQIRNLINLHRNPSEVRWITTQVAEKFGRETYILTTSREMVFYVIYFINLMFGIHAICFGMMTPMRHIFTQSLEDQFINTQFESVYRKITFQDIKSAGDFWKYTETAFIRSVYWDQWYDDEYPVKETEKRDKNILYENTLMAVPGIRQVKVRNDSCKIHPEFRRMFLVCYDTYRTKLADKKPFGLAKGTAWTYNEPENVKSSTHYGKVATYDGGGFYQKLSSKANETKAILETLKDNLWITRGTRSVFIDFTVYNANVNLFCVVQLVFEFPTCGGVIPNAYFFTMKLLKYVSVTDYIILALEIIHVCFVLYYTAEEVREIAYFKWGYLLHFWNYIDLSIILFLHLNLQFSLSYFYITAATVEHFRVMAMIRDASKNPNQYISFRSIVDLETSTRTVMAVILFMSNIKIFKYLNFNNIMQQMNKTLSRCGRELSGFSVMYIMIFASFAEVGYLVFGAQVNQFATFWTALYTLVLSTIHDFDYDLMERSYCIFAPIYAVLFIGLVSVVLLNMFLAIIYDTYFDAKVEITRTRNVLQMTDVWKRGSYSFMYKLRCGKCLENAMKEGYNTTNIEIREALHSAGFYDDDINEFFARHNIDPDVTTDDDATKLKEDLLNYVKELTKGESKENVEDSRLVAMDAFKAHQERLGNLETKMWQIADRLDTVLDKLNTMEYFKKY